MIRVGLTGGIAAGKSVVGEMLADFGCAIIDWDLIARQVVHPGSRFGQITLAKIAARFGQVVTQSGELDRQKLAAQVFVDPQALKQLNQIIHPRIRVLASLADYQAGGLVRVHVVPLLIENRLHTLMDYTVVVDLTEKDQLSRLIKRDGMSVTQAKNRIKSQANRNQRLKHADFVIDNTQGLAVTCTQVEQLWNILVAKSVKNSSPRWINFAHHT